MERKYLTLTVLFLGQGLTGSIISLLTLTSTLAGKMLAPEDYLSTLPVMATVLGSAIMVYYASFLMRKYGRKVAFIIGSIIGLIGSLFAVGAIFYHSFLLLVFSTLIIGGATVFNQYYRFAAAEVFTSHAMKKKCTSFIIGGGVLGGVLGPYLASKGAYYIAEYAFLGSFVISSTVFSLTLIIHLFITLPTPKEIKTDNAIATPHPDSNYVIKTDNFKIATLSCALEFSIMTLLMNSAPLAMHQQNFSLTQSAFILQWHFFAMYAPALILPFTVDKISTLSLIKVGALFFLIGTITSILIDSSAGYLISLITVGMGWSFMFSGGTFLINQYSSPEVKYKAQGLNSLLTYLFNLIASFSAGVIMINKNGWQIVNLTSGCIMIIFLLYLMKNKFGMIER